MPALKNELDADQVWSIVCYVQSLRVKVPQQELLSATYKGNF